MHPYATNSPLGGKFAGYLWCAATILGTVLAFASHQAGAALGWSIGSVSVATLFGLLYFGFDRYFWRWRRVRRFLLVPDLNGTWNCDGRTMSKRGVDVAFEWKGQLTIQQSWTRIAVTLTTAQSRSTSIAASLFREAGAGYRLIYHYDNTPGASERELGRHTGLCKLRFNEEGTEARGDYFSDKDRMTVGVMTLQKEGAQS